MAGRRTTIRQDGKTTRHKTAGPQGVGQQYDDTSSDVSSDVIDDVGRTQDVGRKFNGQKSVDGSLWTEV